MPDMNSQLDLILLTLNRIVETLAEAGLSIKPIDAQTKGTVPVSPWISQDTPPGYNTIIGFLAETHPEMIDLMDDPISGTARDGYRLTHKAHREGRVIHKVEAPEAFVEQGIVCLNAYPIDLLRTHMS